MKLDELNFDCLLQIFSWMSLEEEVRIDKVSQHFENFIVEQLWRRRYKTVTIQVLHERLLNPSSEIERLNVKDFNYFLKLNARNVEDFTIDSNLAYHTIIKLRYLKIPYHDDIISCLRFQYPNLLRLFVQSQQLDEDQMSLISKNCPRLQHLEVIGDKVSGKYIKDIRNLCTLNISYCQLEVKYLNGILSDLPHLRELSFYVSDDDLEKTDVISWGPHLRSLSIAEKAFVKNFLNGHSLPERFGNLRQIFIPKFDDPDSEYIAEWRQWTPFFRQCTQCVRILKVTSLDESFVRSMVNFYRRRSCRRFENLEELHFSIDSSRGFFKLLHDSKSLRVVCIYDESVHWIDILDAIDQWPSLRELKFICLSFDKLCDLQNSLAKLLDEVSRRFEKRRNLSVHFLSLPQDCRQSIEKYQEKFLIENVPCTINADYSKHYDLQVIYFEFHDHLEKESRVKKRRSSKITSRAAYKKFISSRLISKEQ